MIKTAGTSLSKHLIEYYGRGVHIVPGGLSLESKDIYNNERLINDYEKKNKKLKVLIGHPVRSWLDLNITGANLRWFTFVRSPEERYLSHFIHKYYATNQFTHNRFKNMPSKTISEWEKIEKCANYQCKFLSGEANAQKAIDILETKFDWVGLTEEYKSGIVSFKNKFELNNLYVEEKKSNKSLANNEFKNKVKQEYKEFIIENNVEDRKLYEYVKTNIWSKYSNIENTKSGKENLKSNSITRKINFIEFHIDRQIKFTETEINLKNIRRFYNRWMK
jgi:hypothetical protein